MANTDLTNIDEAVLDATQKRLFREHSQAVDAGDKQAATELHWCIQAIQNERARRTQVWIAERNTEGPSGSVGAKQ